MTVYVTVAENTSIYTIITIINNIGLSSELYGSQLHFYQ